MASTSAMDEKHESLYKRVYGVEIAKGFSVLVTIICTAILWYLTSHERAVQLPTMAPVAVALSLYLLTSSCSRLLWLSRSKSKWHTEAHAVAMLVLVVDVLVGLTLILLQSLLNAAIRHHQRWLLSLTVCVTQGVMVILTLSLDTVHLLRVAAYRRVTVHLRDLARDSR